MGEGFDTNIGQGHRLQPAQDTQLGVGITQAGAPKDTAQVAEAQFFPDFGQRPNIAEGAG